MDLKDKISEIIITVYNCAGYNTEAIKDVALDRIMELIKEEKETNHETKKPT